MNHNNEEKHMSGEVASLISANKYGSQLMNPLPPSVITPDVRTDHRMPRARLRRYLGQYGLRGEALRAEVSRIAGGPGYKEIVPGPGIIHTWPCGWEPSEFTPMMRRIFRGKHTRYIVLLNEVARRFA